MSHTAVVTSNLTLIKRQSLIRDLSIATDTDVVQLYNKESDDKVWHLPFYYTISTFGKQLPKDKHNCDFLFRQTLRDNQVSVVKEAISSLHQFNCCIIKCPPGFGKTCMSCYISACANIPVIVLVPLKVLVGQWVSAIKKWLGIDAVIISGDMPNSGTSRFYVGMVGSSYKHIQRLETEAGKYLLVVDEVHACITRGGIYSLLMYKPRYLLGLSATPFRYDELNKAIPKFFGHSVIARNKSHEHEVVIIRTNFTPHEKRCWNPKSKSKGVDWNSIITQQSEDEARNELIVRAAMAYRQNGGCCMIIVKRLDQLRVLSDFFENFSVRVDCLTAKKNEFDKNCDILIGTTKKLGAGFDFNRINVLILAADIQNYFLQVLGRAMRVNNPTVIDFADNHFILRRHLQTRMNEYRLLGGHITTVQPEDLPICESPLND